MSTLTQVEALIELTKNWNDHDLVPKSQKAACREIGKQLNDIGGMDAMRDAYYEAKSRNSSVHVIQAYWDGIGNWRW